MRNSEAEAREQEVAQLIAEQRADDTDRQRPEAHGGDHGRPVLSVEGALPYHLSTDLAGSAVVDAGIGARGGDGPKLVGRFKQSRVEPLWANVEDADGDAARLVREAVAEMTDEQRETFRLVFGERLTYRAAAAQLGIDVSSVRDRVETLKRIVTRALVAAAGGAAEGSA